MLKSDREVQLSPRGHVLTQVHGERMWAEAEQVEMCSVFKGSCEAISAVFI